MDFTKIRNYLFLGLLTVATVLFLYIIAPLAYPIFWAAVLAALFYPVYKRIDKYFKHQTLSILATIFAIALIIILPMLIIATILLAQSVDIYNSLNTNSGQLSATVSQLIQFIHHNKYVSQLNLDDAFITEKINEGSRIVLNYLFNLAKNLTQNSLQFVLEFMLMLYTLYFFLRDGEKILRKIMYLCPLGDRYEVMLYKKFSAVAGATIRGTLAVGAIQGTLGGILFAVTGINGAVVWGIIMAALSIIPATGSFLVWLPAGIIMLVTGHTWQGILILIIGTFVISVIDNLLRPILVGKGLEIHPLVILFSTLGGLYIFGITGFVIGPVVASLFLSFWEMYEEYYHKELANN